MRNKLMDLNNHLFEQLERLNDDELAPEELEKEIKRSKAISNVAKNIIANGNLILDAQEIQLEYGRTKFTPLELLEQRKE
jgi:hypothetical protein